MLPVCVQMRVTVYTFVWVSVTAREANACCCLYLHVRKCRPTSGAGALVLCACRGRLYDSARAAGGVQLARQPVAVISARDAPPRRPRLPDCVCAGRTPTCCVLSARGRPPPPPRAALPGGSDAFHAPFGNRVTPPYATLGNIVSSEATPPVSFARGACVRCGSAAVPAAERANWPRSPPGNVPRRTAGVGERHGGAADFSA